LEISHKISRLILTSLLVSLSVSALGTNGIVAKAFAPVRPNPLSNHDFQFWKSSQSALANEPLQTQQAVDEASIRRVLESLLKALQTRDFATYITLWSENSPSYSRQQASKAKIESDNFDFTNPQFSRFTLIGNNATIRLAVDTRTPGSIKESAVRRLFYSFVLIKEGGSWKIWNQSDAQSDLAKALAQPQSQVNSLLREESELVNLYLVQELVNQGKAMFFSDSSGARKSFELAFEVAQVVYARSPTPSSKNAIGAILHNLANTERAQGNYGKVLEYEEKALAYATTPKLKTDALANIGITYALQNDYDLAFRFLNLALKSAEAIKEEPERRGLLGLIYDSLGNLSSLEQKFDQALKYYEQSLSYRPTPQDKAQTLDNIGIVYHRKLDYKAAIERYKESLKLIEGKSNLILIRATVLNNLSSATLAQGDIPAAIKYAEETATLAKQINMPELLWRAYLIEAKARRHRGESPKARKLLNDSIDVIEGMRGRAGGGIAGRQRFLEDKLQPYSLMIDLLMSEGRTAEAFEYSERSKANAILEALSSGSVFLQRIQTVEEQRQQQGYLSELTNLNSAILRIQLQSPTGNSELSNLIERRNTIQEKYDAFLDVLYSKYFRLQTKNGKILTIKLEETARLLTDEHTAIVEFSVGDNATYLYVITTKSDGQGVNVFTQRIEISQTLLASQIEAFRSQIDQNKRSYANPGRDLFNLLLAKATPQLAGKSTIILVPDGPLWDLPFQALEVMPGHPWLQDHAMFQAPSLTALREIRTQRNTARSTPGPALLALINPKISRQLRRKIEQTRLDIRLSALPDTKDQVKTLQQIYGGPPASLILRGQRASEERFRREASRSRIIYLFAHGVISNENPMRSYMVLSPTSGQAEETDGLLEAGELMSIRLSADLVILSGCETARGRIGRGEGIIGLAWATFIAGASTVVVSQWRIPAVSTGLLMSEFHRALPAGGGSFKTTAEALQYAALETRKKGRKHPLYWAGFVIIGDGT
jgi:CHAT domain-containing protein/tetratricopeptide (TPR) repeat protein